MLESLLMHEYTECYLYYSCYQDESDPKIKSIWEQHLEQEIAHLHIASELLECYEGTVWQKVIPDGKFPELLASAYHRVRQAGAANGSLPPILRITWRSAKV